MTFRQWTERYLDSDAPSGELARLVHDDEYFPEVRSKVMLEAHLYNLTHDEGIIPVFRRAWKAYLEFERKAEII